MHERTECRRMQPPAHGDQGDFAPDLGLDQRADDQVGALIDAILRQEAEAEAGGAMDRIQSSRSLR